MSNHSTDGDHTNIQYHSQRLMFTVRDLDVFDRRQDKLRLAFFLLGSLGTAVIVLGFVWTFISYTQSQRISLAGGVTALVGGVGGFIVNIFTIRQTKSYIRQALKELETLKTFKDNYVAILKHMSEMCMGEVRRYPFQIPMLTLLPGMAMFNSLHNFNHTDECPLGNDRFSGLSQSDKSMCVLDLVVGLIGLGVSVIGACYHVNRLMRCKGAWVSGKIKAVIDVL